MERKTAFVKVSGDLIDTEGVLTWLKTITQDFFTVVCVGGGTQISRSFRERGFPIAFGPQGRITSTFEQRQLAREVLEENKLFVQNCLNDNDIMAMVIIPVLDVPFVSNHINGDDIARMATGYDKVFILTLKDRMEDKEKQFKDCPTITIVGF